MCEIHGPRASGRHKTLRLHRRVLWWCVKYMALGPPVATKPSGFAIGFCGARSPEGHVFHTSRQAMIKTYNTAPLA